MMMTMTTIRSDNALPKGRGMKSHYHLACLRRLVCSSCLNTGACTDDWTGGADRTSLGLAVGRLSSMVDSDTADPDCETAGPDADTVGDAGSSIAAGVAVDDVGCTENSTDRQHHYQHHHHPFDLVRLDDTAAAAAAGLACAAP